METQFGLRPVVGYRAGLRVEWLGIAFVTLLALAMRVWFIRAGTVVDPMVGDALQYCQYAWNLVHFMTFSMAAGNQSVIPDSFRDPGYPVFLAGLLALLKPGEAWYGAVLFFQAALGALSVALTILIARRWLAPNAALAAGLAIAVWPHNVSISGFLLSESLFCFASLLAVWLFCRASESTASARWVLAGFAFGAASLVNATMTPFALLLTLLLAIRRAAPRRLLLTMLLASLALPGIWAVRGATLSGGASSASRAMMNLVEGSWPEYYDAYFQSTWASGDVRNNAGKTMQSIGDELQLASKSPLDGLSSMFQRFKRAPVHYLSWYAWKPGLLWAWSIRMGWGDVYPYPMLHSLYVSNTPMRMLESLCVAINPVLFILMALTAAVTLIRFSKSSSAPGLYAVALFVAYETAVYTVLQAEPRYSIPFRPFQMLLAATAACWLWRLWVMRAGRQPVI